MIDFEKDRFEEILQAGLKELSLSVTDEEMEKMSRFGESIIVTNRSFNLTRILSMDEMAIKHFVDSLSCLLIEFPKELKVIDVGTGAGFPGIPLAICCPNWSIVLLDSLRKRLDFLDQIREELQLANTSTIHVRAEDAGKDDAHREQYDLVVSRAVASLPILLEFCGPLTKVGGRFLAMKGQDWKDEVEISGRACKVLGLEIEEIVPFSLPFEMGERRIIVFRKIEPTPRRYPRRAGIPSKQPL